MPSPIALISVFLVAGLAAPPASEASLVATSSGGTSAKLQEAVGNPVQRVAKLLIGLREQLEKEYKAEENEYLAKRCASQKAIDAREEDISSSKTRTDELKQYAADIKAGKIDFTTQAADLAEQVQEISKGIKVVEVNRDTEEKDYAAASRTLSQAITALDGVLKILSGLKTTAKKPKAFLDVMSTSRTLQSEMLRVAEYGRGLIGADDWRNMFKNGENDKLLKILRQMRLLFQKEYDEVVRKEKEDKTTFKKVKGAKAAMLANAKQELGVLGVENGARGNAKVEADDQVDSLADQQKADEKFVKDEKFAMELKRVTWLYRAHLRKEEMKAVEMALQVVTSDDAKDTFSKAFDDFLFLQTHSTRHTTGKFMLNSSMRATVESWAKTPSLALAALHEGIPAVDKVIVSIKTIIKEKEEEVVKALAYKERCEQEIADSAAGARKRALAVDTLSERVQSSDSKYQDLKKLSDQYKDKVKELNNQIAEVAKKRDNDVRILEEDSSADAAASALIAKAVDILKNWRKRAGKPKGLKAAPKMVLAESSSRVVQANAVNATGGVSMAHLEGLWCQEDAGYICEMDITKLHQAFSCQGLKGLYHISMITAQSFHCSGGFGGGGGMYDGSSILWDNKAVFHRVRWGQTRCRRDTQAFKAWQMWFHGETHKEDVKKQKAARAAKKSSRRRRRKAKQSANIAGQNSKLSGGSQSANIAGQNAQLSGGPQSANIAGQTATLSGGPKKAPTTEAKLGNDGNLKQAPLKKGQKPSVGPKAPKPDPNAYQGHAGTGNIVAIMEEIKDELDEDVKQSKLEADNTKASAQKEIDDLKQEVKAAKNTESTYGKDSATADKKKIEGITNRLSSGQSLQSIVAFYKATWDRCADVIVDFPDHVKARDMQLDNLRHVLHQLQSIDLS